MLRWFLFQTKAGEWLLGQIERRCGLCIVEVDVLQAEPSCTRLGPAAAE